MKTKKIRIQDIVDSMLLKGTHTRAEVMAEVRRLRPDYKDVSTAVSDGVARLHKQGKSGGYVDMRQTHSGHHLSTAAQAMRRKRRLERLDTWVAMDEENLAQAARRRRTIAEEMDKRYAGLAAVRWPV